MKKLFCLAVFCVFLLTGCGAGVTETMSCTYDTIANGISSNIMYSVDHQDDEVKKVRITYTYDMNEVPTQDNTTDGVGTGTDGTTNDNLDNNDGIVDGVVGSAIDTVVNSITGTILDIAGLRSTHINVQNAYGNMPGFSVQNTTDVSDNHYTVTYVIDYDSISNDDLSSLNLSRDFNTLRSNYISQGFSCK